MKGSKKILSLGLAVAMAFSVGASAFAASAAENEPVYTPTYNDRVTEEKVEELITMADGALDSMVWANYGGTVVNAIYGVLPQLGSFAADFGTVAFYQSLDAELFADLTPAEGETEVTAESMAAYLETHTASVATAQDLYDTIENLLKNVLPAFLKAELPTEDILGFNMDGATVLYMVYTMLSGYTVFPGISDLLTALGLDPERKLLGDIVNNELVDEDTGAGKEDLSQAVNSLTNSVMDVVKLLLPNTVDKVLTLVKNYANNQEKVLAAVNQITNSESGLPAALDLVGGLLSDVDLSGVQDVIAKINSYIAQNMVGEEEPVLNIDGLVNQLLTDNGIGSIVAGVADGEESTAMLKLSSINDLIASIADEGVESSADVLMVAYNYLYDNIFGNDQNYTTIKYALPLIANFLPDLGLDEATVQMITEMIPTITGLLDQLKAAGPLGTMDTLMVMLGILEDPNAVTPTDPTQPSDGGNTTDTENPATGDAALGAVVMMGTAAAAAVVLLRRKK